MNLEAQTETVTPIDRSAAPKSDSGPQSFESMKQSAALEFHATTQLLAERARFLTGAAGVALALDQDGQFIYTAAVGNLVPRIGATADIAKYPLRKCIKTGDAVRLPGEAGTLSPNLAIAIFKNEKVVGFFELSPGATDLEDADVEAIIRLSVMVTTALDHLEAAERSALLIREACPPQPAVPPRPVLWHAPELPASEPKLELPHPPAAADVHPCSACGFPVSGVRTLCVDCDAKREEPKTNPLPLAQLFTSQKEESWISAHGYTIASVLVSALAVAIIYWLR